MKNIVIKTKFDDCKNLREILNLINTSFFEKTAYYLLNIWILYPLLMILITYTFNNDIARDLMFYILLFIGSSGILLGIMYGLKKFYRKEKFNVKKYLPIILGIILLLWCLITSFFSRNYNLSIFGESYRKEGLQTYFLYGGVLLLGIILKNKKYLLNVFNRLLFVQIVIAIISLINNSFTYSLIHNQEPYTGIFSQFNHYGYYLMFGIILSIFMTVNNKQIVKRIIYIIIYSFLLYMLLLNDTFGCFLSVLLTIIFITIYSLFKKNQLKRFIPIIVSFVLISILTYKNNENVVYKNFNRFFGDVKVVNDVVKETKKEKDETKKKEIINKIDSIGTARGNLWKHGFKYIGENPIFGHGIESTYLLYPSDGIKQSRPHNILIQFGIFTGIPGVILYILFISSILIRNLKKIKRLDDISIFSLFIVMCYLISSMFGNSMFYTSPYFFIFLGIICRNAFYKKELN